MAGKVKRIRDGCHTVAPHLVVSDSLRAIEFYKKAFGAEELCCHAGPGGKIMHAEVRIGDSRVFLNDEFPGMCRSPQSLGGTPVTIHLAVEDVDRLYRQALDAGAQVLMPLADQFWGDRYGIVTDPFGHQWSMASHLKDMTEEEIKKAGEAHFANANGHGAKADECAASGA